MDGPYALMSAIVRFDLGEEPCELKTPPFGANMALKKTVFQKYGLFRTDLGPTAGTLRRGEDTELCRRLITPGESLVYAPEAIVYHPVAEERMRKRYFESWYFNYGRSSVRVDGIPASSIRCFGLPRYLLRSLVEFFLKWIGTLNSQRRFYYKLQLFRVAGEITEACRLSLTHR